MGLVIDGHDVKGLALGGNSFYSLQKNDDGSLSIEGKTFVDKSKVKSDRYLATLPANTKYSKIDLSLIENDAEYSDTTIEDEEIVVLAQFRILYYDNTTNLVVIFKFVDRSGQRWSYLGATLKDNITNIGVGGGYTGGYEPELHDSN